MGSENSYGGFRPDEEEEDFGLSEILPQYFDLCRRDLLHLQAALKENDFEQVRVLGHNLKGSGGAYGFPVLTEIGASLETSGKSQDSLLAKSATERLAEFLNTQQSKGS
jgi:HPt (histidine-containing phosphotransfer) domain-containing protein